MYFTFVTLGVFIKILLMDRGEPLGARHLLSKKIKAYNPDQIHFTVKEWPSVVRKVELSRPYIMI